MEGPSLVILKDEIAHLKGEKIQDATGSAGIDKTRLIGKKIKSIRSHGKHFLIVFSTFAIRIHFLMFGSYRVNERKEREPRLSLRFEKDELNFYTCAVTLLEGNLNEIYDWEVDVLSERWNPTKARKKLKKTPSLNVGDALLDQGIFAGVGNIIKNEVLYRIMVHPECTIGSLPSRTLTALINEARIYSFDFLGWKKEYTLKKHWLIYKKKKCRRCNLPVLMEYTGKTQRRTFFCEGCQILYQE
jgi:endonuclease VIII